MISKGMFRRRLAYGAIIVALPLTAAAAAAPSVLAATGAAHVANTVALRAAARPAPAPEVTSPAPGQYPCGPDNDGRIIGPFGGTGYYLRCTLYDGVWQWIVYIPSCPNAQNEPSYARLPDATPACT